MAKWHTINSYQIYCKPINQSVLSDSSLWKILKSIKPSQQHSLAGLDDTTCEGINGFISLMKCVAKVSTDANTIKDIERRLEKAKRYLKTTYGLQCIKVKY